MRPGLTPPVGARDHAQGPADAPVTLVEYGDFECPRCGWAYPIVKAVQARMGNELRFVFRNFPLAKSHEHAEHAAEMAEAAGHKGKFWPMHDLLFENQDALEDEDLVGYAASLGIDPQWAAAALEQGSFRERVREDFASGVKSGVNGTPTFFINGVRYDGLLHPTALLEALVSAAHAGMKVLLATRDLIFRSKLGAVVREGGGEMARDEESSDLVVLDVEAPGAVERIRGLALQGVSVLAFGPHVRADLLRAAREAGATAVPNSQVEQVLAERLRA
jgi:predicted DsbA family dithiol-disulfide isomerase